MIKKIKLIFDSSKNIISKYYIHILFMILCPTLWAIFIASAGYINLKIVDTIYLFEKNIAIEIIKITLIKFFIFSFIVNLLWRIHNYLIEIKMKPNMRKEIIEMLFKYISKKNHIFFLKNTPEKISEKIKDYSESLPELLNQILSKFYAKIVNLAIPLISILIYGPKYSFLIIFLWAVLFILYSYVKSKKLILNYESFIKASIGSRIKINDIVINQLSLKLFRSLKYEENNLKESLILSSKNEAYFEWEYAKIWIFYSSSYFLSIILISYFMINGLKNGTVTPGQFSFIWSLSGAIVNELWVFAVSFAETPKYIGKIYESINLIIEDKSIDEDEGFLNKNKNLLLNNNNISFENVTFYYNNEKKIFNNLSFEIKENQKIALVGYSGSGKTTLVNLILRLYKIKEGSIKIDGIDINNLTLDNLYSKISLIPQNPLIFKRSIKENILYGNLNASMEEVINAAKKASIHDFIISLKDGYESIIGINGFELSGGQKQRIIIARAFLKNSPILILDEATSSLDSLTERKIQESLNLLMTGKTVITIAHRLSTIINMDRILVFENGNIVQDGSHKELIVENGLYKKLWDTQINVFLADKNDLTI